MEYYVGNIDRLELCIRCPHDVSKIEEFLDCGEHSRDWVAQVVNCFLNNLLLFKELVRNQLTVVFLHMCEYYRHGVVYGVRRPVADIRQMRCLDCANDFLYKSLFQSRHLTEQAHFLGVRDPHIGVCVGSSAIRNDEKNHVSRVSEGSGRDECVLHLSKY